MAILTGEKSESNHVKEQSDPPGKIKIADALKTLLKEKDFNSITTAEIAATSGVNEALIYRYYKDKRGLLHHILSKYLRESEAQIDLYLRDTHGTFSKLKKVIWHTFDTYDKNRIFAKILLIEVRNFPGYFKSETYALAKHYSSIFNSLFDSSFWILAKLQTKCHILKNSHMRIEGIILKDHRNITVFWRNIINDYVTDRYAS